MSFLDELVGSASAPEFIDAAHWPDAEGTGLFSVLATLGSVFPEPLFIVDEQDTLLWMNLAMADRICRDNALEPDFAVEWLLSQLIAQQDELVCEGHHAIDGAAPVRVIALADVLGRPEWLSVQVCEIPHDDRIFRLVVLQDVTPIQRDALALQEENAMLSHALRHDLTTGLASRDTFLNALTGHRLGTAGAIIAIQIVGFRQQKARHGARAASRVAERLAMDFVELIEDEMLLARLAEDRFAVLIGHDAGADTLANRAERIAASLCTEHHLPSGTWAVRLKVACARTGGAALPMGDLLDEVEASLTEGPPPHGAALVHVRVEDGARSAKRKRDAQLAMALEAALHSEQIEAFLQPAVSCDTGNVAFVEAVARWRHPENGLIPPSLFLAAAEAAGLGPAIDLCVARSACAAAARWAARGDRLCLSLNLSPFLLSDPEARGELCEIFLHHGVEPDRIIVESAVPPQSVPSPTPWQEGIRHLREQGLRFALDDAGGRHTDPLEVFSWVPDFVKVSPDCVAALARYAGHPDRESCPEAEDTLASARARAQVHYLRAAQMTGAHLVAVGVQDAQVLRAVSDIGFTHMQGHLIARPMSQAQFERWLQGCDRIGEGVCRAPARSAASHTP